MTGPLAPLFDQVREGIGAGKQAWFSGRYSEDGVLLGDMTADEWNAKSGDALAALSSIERHVQEDVEEWERIASEKGLPFLLDHLGLDGLANELVSIERHVQDMEKQAALDAERAAVLSSAVGKARLILNDASAETTALIDAALPAREKGEE